MKLKSLLSTSLIIGSFMTSSSFAAPTEYAIDPSHSKVGFEVGHLVISTVEGKFTQFSGSINLDDKLEKSSVTAQAETSSIDTSNGERDKHLKSADFFDVQKFPKIEFKSLEVSGKPEDLSVIGNLTIKGKSQKVTFKGKYLGKVNDPFGNERIAFSLKTSIKRKEFGLVYGAITEAGPVIGDEVTIDLKIEAMRPLPKKK